MDQIVPESNKLFAVHRGPQLKSLIQWNAERQEYWRLVRDRAQHPENYPNGLKCPKCQNGDLYDTGREIERSPVKLQVQCRSCDFKGARYE